MSKIKPSLKILGAVIVGTVFIWDTVEDIIKHLADIRGKKA
jgi:hypothetical protein